MIQTNKFTITLFTLFCLLSFYSFGTAMMDYFLLYPSRFAVGEREFIAYHKVLESAIIPISVIPFLAIIIINVLIFWFRPTHVSKTFLWISLTCLILDLLSTVLIQAPWNFELGEGKNIELMEKITATNWFRVVLETVQVVVVFFMMREFLLKLSSPTTINVER